MIPLQPIQFVITVKCDYKQARCGNGPDKSGHYSNHVTIIRYYGNRDENMSTLGCYGNIATGVDECYHANPVGHSQTRSPGKNALTFLK